MLTRKSPASTQDANVGMAQIFVVSGESAARTVLGSCIGLVLFHKPRRIAAMAHIVLPSSSDRPGPRGKFADTAIPELLRLLAAEGAGRPSLSAKLAGGANMFGGTGPIQIGAQNHQAVAQALAALNIPITGEHVGGDKGRRVSFQPSRGVMIVEIAGQPPIEI